MGPFKRKVREYLLGIVYFFPFQLVTAHLKRNHILLFFWFITFGLVTQQLAAKYGLPQLLLYPEYLGEVNMLSHVLLGLTCGAFVVAFNMSSYIINGYRFQFIATLSKPFLKYSINNFIIPLTFYVIYMYNMVQYQLYSELLNPTQVTLNITGFILGNVIFHAISMTYFVNTNTSILDVLKIPVRGKTKKYRPIQNLLEPDLKWFHILKRKSNWKIETYISGRLRIKRARSSKHYSRETLREVFKQNHLNASLFALGAIATIFLLGWGAHLAIFEIPAGASIFLLLGMILMFSGALHNWLRGWSIVGFFGLFLIINHFSGSSVIRIHSEAFGLSYDSRAPYSNEHLNRLIAEKDVKESVKAEEKRLTAIQDHVDNDRVLVLVNSSGGGLRSALWTFHVLQQMDSISNGGLTKHTALVTGASGGMIGAAYYRELFLRNRMVHNRPNVSYKYSNNASKDLLNRMSFAWVVNDFFVRFRTFEYHNRPYLIDRGYYFEEKLLENLEGVLDVPVSYYDPFVTAGDVPDIWLTPTMANDGRRMIISSSPTHFLYNSVDEVKKRISHVDFRALLSEQNGDSLRFTSALRMNATFPFVLPGITLPTEPSVELLDAGVRDNFGTNLSWQYISAMREWFSENVDQIVLVRIVDNSDKIRIKDDSYKSLVNSVFSPVGSVYGNLFNYQRLGQEEMYGMISPELRSKIKVFNFSLDLDNTEYIPLSWHLSTKAKIQIRAAFHSVDNTLEMQRLKSVISK